jgi:hypothetical protein
MAQVFAPNSWGNVSGPVAEWCRKLAEAIGQIASGASKTVGSVTLTASAASTTVTSEYVTGDCHVSLTPTTANAAAEIGNGTLYVSARTNGASFQLTHANSAQTDRTFTYEIRRP